jgi:hypothetical protein
VIPRIVLLADVMHVLTEVISYGGDAREIDLPVTSERPTGQEGEDESLTYPFVVRSGGNRAAGVGTACQSFNRKQVEECPGWISGHVRLPPAAIKDPEGVGMCSQVGDE